MRMRDGPVAKTEMGVNAKTHTGAAMGGSALTEDIYDGVCCKDIDIIMRRCG